MFLFSSVQLMEAQQVDITKINCTYIHAEFTGTVCNNCYLFTCGPSMGNYMELQEKQGSNWVTINTKPGLNHTFYLVSGKTYRVRAKYVTLSGCVTALCTLGWQTYCLGVRGTATSREYFAADPEPDAFIVDASGTP